MLKIMKGFARKKSTDGELVIRAGAAELPLDYPSEQERLLSVAVDEVQVTWPPPR